MHILKRTIGLLLLPTSLYAATSEDSLTLLGSEELFIGDMPTVISATRLKQPINESPVSTTIIDSQMIKASGAQNIADLLRLVPGFSVGNLSGNYPVAGYHGQSDRFSRRLQLLIDGRSVYLPTLSGISWSDLVIGIEDIERIEVIRGPNASTYGNNSFSAVVSIITKHASANQGQYIKTTVGSKQTADVMHRFADSTENADYRVSVGTKNNDGTNLLRDFTETDYLSYRLDYQLDNNTQLFYQGGIQDSEYGNLFESRGYVPTDVDVRTVFQHLRLERSFSDQSSLALQYYYNYTHSYESSFAFTIDGSPYGVDSFDIFNTLDLTSQRHDLEATYYFQPLTDLRMVTGASIRLDSVDADSVYDPDADNYLMLYRGYSHGEYSINDELQLNAGIMLEKNDLSGTDVAPRLSFIYQPSHQHSLRIGASKATRTPVMFDEIGFYALDKTLTVNGGDPLPAGDIRNALGGDKLIDVGFFSPGGVASEKIISLELGWMMNLLNNRLTLDFKLFRDTAEDLIFEIKQDANIPTENIQNILPDEEGANYFDNAAQSITKGFEFYSDYQVQPDLRLYSFFSYLLIDAKKTNALADDSVVGQLEESVPRRSYGLMLMKEWKDSLNTSITIYHVSDMDWLDRTHDRINPTLAPHTDRSAEAYTKLDLVIRKSSIINKTEIDYSLIIQNIGNSYWDYTRTSYERNDPTTVKIPGSLQDTRAYFEVALKFN
jgi:iron complex outermembrane recepter protein